MSSESTKKTIIVALCVCIICSILVSTAAVSLKTKQEENKRLDKIKNILDAADLLPEDARVEDIYKEKIKPVIIDLDTGKTIPKEEYTEILNAEKFDIKTMVKEAEYSRTLSADVDIARIKRIPKYMAIYLVKEGDTIEKIILPVYGTGLWSTMYGFIAMGKDLKTVKGFTFYEHGETPGLGGEVDNPRWKKQWKGKKVYDDEWNLRIEVLKGKVDQMSPDAIHQIDGLSGSTLTTRGVDQLVKFWLGKNGYNSLIDRLKEEIKNGQI